MKNALYILLMLSTPLITSCNKKKSTYFKTDGYYWT